MRVVSEDGFERFVAENYDRIRRVLGVALGDADRAEELAQEAFTRAYARWRSVSQMDRPVAWVYVVAMNKARRDFRRDEAPQEMVEGQAQEDPAGRVATSVTLKAALAELSPRQRAVVVLRCLADLSTAEVADALRCAPGTVKATLHVGLKRLRIELEEGGME